MLVSQLSIISVHDLIIYVFGGLQYLDVFWADISMKSMLTGLPLAGAHVAGHVTTTSTGHCCCFLGHLLSFLQHGTSLWFLWYEATRLLSLLHWQTQKLILFLCSSQSDLFVQKVWHVKNQPHGILLRKRDALKSLMADRIKKEVLVHGKC